MSEIVDQKLFTQDELVLLGLLSVSAQTQRTFEIGYDEAGMLTGMARRLALRVTQLQKLVEANGS
jgi:hypothetical protein